jgi:hypothetical protein
MKLKTLTRPFEVKSVAADGTFTGYGSTFGDVDYGRDVVMRGAFAKSLESHAAKNRPVPMLWQHKWDQPIGVYTTIKEDDKGLYVEGEINMKVQQGVEAHALMEQRALSGLSIGYSTIRDEWDERAMVRKLFEVELFEVSPVTFPMNDNGRIETVKSLADLHTISDIEDFLRDAGSLSRSEAKGVIARMKAVTGQREADGEAAAIQRAIESIRNIHF